MTQTALDLVKRKPQAKTLNLTPEDLANWDYLKAKGYNPAILVRLQLDLLARELKAKEEAANANT